MSAPRVSVVIPTYNCAHLLPRAIRSAYDQSVEPAEVVVVNDGSTDNTAEVLDRLAPELPSSFVFESKPNGGEASGRNRGVELASGDLIAFIDQDDVWAPDKLERQLEVFAARPEAGLVFCAYTRVDGSRRQRVGPDEWHSEPAWVLRRLMNGSCIAPSTAVVRREVLEAVPPFDESLWLGCDWTMWLEIAAAGHRIEYLDEALVEYEWHETNMSRDSLRVSSAAIGIFERLFASGCLPAEVQQHERRCLARWHMIHACNALEDGQDALARSEIVTAAQTHPASVRPGWLGIWARSLPLGRRPATAS